MKKRVPQRRRNEKASRKPRKTMVLDALTGENALSILKALAERDKKLAAEIDAVAAEVLGKVDAEEVAADVMWALESLNIEDVWDRSGPRRDGYVDPGEAAWKMIDEALAPFFREVEKYQTLSMGHEASVCCQGLLMGIYDFDQDSPTEFKDWAVDAPAEFFREILDRWKAIPERRPELSKMQKFIEVRCPKYAEWGARCLRSS